MGRPHPSWSEWGVDPHLYPWEPPPQCAHTRPPPPTACVGQGTPSTRPHTALLLAWPTPAPAPLPAELAAEMRRTLGDAFTAIHVPPLTATDIAGLVYGLAGALPPPTPLQKCHGRSPGIQAPPLVNPGSCLTVGGGAGLNGNCGNCGGWVGRVDPLPPLQAFPHSPVGG